MSTNLKMTRGDTKVVRVTVSHTTLPPNGLAGYSFWFTAKNDVSDLDTDAVIKKVPADFTTVTVGDDTTTDGVATCKILPTDTSSLADFPVPLFYDVQAEDGAGNVTTIASGTFTVSPDVTRAS